MNSFIDGNTEVLVHIGYPTHSFKSELIYNPYFVKNKINVVILPFACNSSENFPILLKSLLKLKNVRGAVITMPFKVEVLKLLDEISVESQIAGSCNAVILKNGKLVGDMFDGEGFVRALRNKNFSIKNSSGLILGCGGVGSAISASLSKYGIKKLALFDLNNKLAEKLAERLNENYPDLKIIIGEKNPRNFNLIVNATPLGMEFNDKMPIDVNLLNSNNFVADVVLTNKTTALLNEAITCGCQVQFGYEMLFEQIPAYLEFFDLPTTSAENLRRIAKFD